MNVHPFFVPEEEDSPASPTLLQELAERAADLLPARACSILLFDPLGGGRGARLRLAAHSAKEGESADMTPPHVTLQVTESGRPILTADPSFLSVPIFFEGKVAGTLNASRPGGGGFDERNLLLAETIARHVGSVLEKAQLGNILRSRLLQAALARKSKGERSPGQPLRGAAAEELATLVAKTFYREMTRAGFGTDQIIRAATEILSLLGERVRKHRTRQKREHGA